MIDLDLVCSGGAGYAGERRGPGQVAAYSTVRFRVPRRTRGTPCAAVGRCARACGPGLLDSNIPNGHLDWQLTDREVIDDR